MCSGGGALSMLPVLHGRGGGGRMRLRPTETLISVHSRPLLSPPLPAGPGYAPRQELQR